MERQLQAGPVVAIIVISLIGGIVGAGLSFLIPDFMTDAEEPRHTAESALAALNNGFHGALRPMAIVSSRLRKSRRSKKSRSSSRSLSRSSRS